MPDVCKSVVKMNKQLRAMDGGGRADSGPVLVSTIVSSALSRSSNATNYVIPGIMQFIILCVTLSAVTCEEGGRCGWFAKFACNTERSEHQSSERVQ